MQKKHLFCQRRGAIVPLFALIFPVLIIFCAIAINLAYLQLSQTEMQVAVDVAVHAGGRRLGTPITNDDGTVQNLEEAKADVMDFAAEIAAMNSIAGRPAVITPSAMEFGRSSRALRNNGSFASYQFAPTGPNQIPSSFRIITDDLRLPHKFGSIAGSDSFAINAASVSTQVERDVVLVLDRSGSMVRFEDEDLLEETLDDLRGETYTEGEDLREYRVQFLSGSWWRHSGVFGYATQAQWDAGEIVNPPYTYRLNYNDWRWRDRAETVEKITEDEYDDATHRSASLQWYSSNVVYWLEQKENPFHALGDEPDAWTNNLSLEQQRAKLTGHMALYAHDHRYAYRLNNRNLGSTDRIDERKAPAFSRWFHLERGVNVFLNVLGGGTDPNGLLTRDGTVQKEQVAILPFNTFPDTISSGVYQDTNPNFDYGLQNDGFPANFVNDSGEFGYDEPHPGSSISLREHLPSLAPYGLTAIGDSLREAVHIIRSASPTDSEARARPFAAKTIVVLTDGDNTRGTNPVTVARDELAQQDVIVHTITFTPGISQGGRDDMAEVARLGKGKYYHTNSGDELGRIFEEIANNLPTILTQ